MTEPLSPRQADVLRVFLRARVANLPPPTLRDLGKVLGLRSTNGANDHIVVLRRKGYLRVAMDKSARAHQLTPAAIAWATSNGFVVCPRCGALEGGTDGSSG